MTTGLQTWSSSGRVVLTVTPEGRVVPGEGLQMDAVAREFLAACDVYCASREAENARLRERVAVLTAAGRAMAEALLAYRFPAGAGPDRDADAKWAVAEWHAALAQADDGGRA